MDLTWTHLDSLDLTWLHLDSLDLTRTHLISLGFTWIHLISLGLTWIHLISLGLTWTHLISLGLTWFHLDSLGLTWSHLDSLDLTWIPLISVISREREHMISQGKRERIPVTKPAQREKGKGTADDLGSFPPGNPPRARTHDTKRFPGYGGACLKASHSPQPPIYRERERERSIYL